MTNVIIIGIVVALAAIIVYISRAWGKGQKERADLEENSKSTLDRLSTLEKERIRLEYELRKNETYTDDGGDTNLRTGVSRKDGDNLN